jgi:hypothetical protein
MTLGAVQWAGPFLPEYKLSPGLAMLPNVAELIVHVLVRRVPCRAGYCASAATSAPGLASPLPQLLPRLVLRTTRRGAFLSQMVIPRAAHAPREAAELTLRAWRRLVAEQSAPVRARSAGATSCRDSL